MLIKICGITKLEQGQAIASLGATSLGFICVTKSPRYINPQQIKLITQELSSTLDCIGVFVNTSFYQIKDIVIEGGLTGVQLHGDESPDFCRQLRQLLPNIKIIKALRVKNWQSLSQAHQYSHCIDTLLLDAYHPQLAGGTGKTLNWESLREFQYPLPWLLAGGLTPDNIIMALSQLQPDGIDLSSGVEHSPGDKDLAKVALLFEKLKSLGV